MKKLFRLMFSITVLALMSLFMGNVLANGIGEPAAVIPISATLFTLGFIPLEQTGVLALALNAKDIVYPQGRFNPGGLQGEVYYAFEEDIQSWPAALVNIDTETAVEFADLVTVPAADPFVLKATKSFKKLYVTLETGELKFSLIGPRDSKAFSNSMEISYPSNDAEILGFIASSANRRLVFLVKETNGRIKVLGTPGFPAQLETVEGTTGKLVEDGNVAVQTYLSKSAIPAPIYKAPIPLDPAP